MDFPLLAAFSDDPRLLIEVVQDDYRSHPSQGLLEVVLDLRTPVPSCDLHSTIEGIPDPPRTLPTSACLTLLGWPLVDLQFPRWKWRIPKIPLPVRRLEGRCFEGHYFEGHCCFANPKGSSG
jgi:hypothetical protein